MLEQYLNALRAVGKSDITIKNYRSQLVKFFDWLADNDGSPDEITSIDAVEYRDYLQNERGLKPGSVNTALATIEAYCKWLQEEGRLDHNPLAKVKKVDQVRNAPKWLTKSEKYRVIRAALKEKNPRNKAIILTLLTSGLRVSELVNLRPDDVMLSDRKGSIVVRAGKGNKMRIVSIPKDLRDTLGEYLVDGRATGTWLFDSQRGEKLTDKGVQHLCSDIGRKAGIEGLTPHVMRHTYCHDLVTKGVGLEVVARLAGHSKIETTMIYTQPGEQELQAAVEKLSFT
ncbi:tyrosine-type recombinase/integrase [Alicyclobacillus tolerans]|uniref:tyrosine-type recombinase/integrase n=1 Tax=Alicyclobacillus tolerans TaxID=90970 RepID=UPI001F017152|nr:tyrosine-type recombinase/integrase [Alicyclobacillus tolerans]MCF8566896.1 tyrosine-type recombinase/integrase [Alicyclobacillus tolerans]